MSSGDLGVLQERDQLVDSVGNYISRKIGNGDALAKVVKPNVNNQVFDLCLRGRELITRFSYENNLVNLNSLLKLLDINSMRSF